MNKVMLMGRLTRKPEISWNEDDLCIARFTLAVDRRFKREGQQDADFISCVAFGKGAEVCIIDVQLRTSEHRSMYSYVRLSIDRCTATYV